MPILINIQTQIVLRSPMSHSLHSIWEKVTCSASTLWMRLQSSWFGVPVYNLRMQIDSIINLWANCNFSSMLMLFALSLKLEKLLLMGLGWPGPLQGLSNFKSPLLFYLWFPKTCTHSKQSGHSHSWQSPGKLKARSEACSVLSLTPEQYYLISLTISLRIVYA